MASLTGRRLVIRWKGIGETDPPVTNTGRATGLIARIGMRPLMRGAQVGIDPSIAV